MEEPHPSLYLPLDLAKHEIRVFRILPEVCSRSSQDTAEPIQCISQHVSLLEKPVYHALSYTWQDESLRETFDDPDKADHQIAIQSYVLLDGLKLAVTKNLWVALWHFRRAAWWRLDHPDSIASEFGDLELLTSKSDILGPYNLFSGLNVVTADLLWWVDAICINQKDVPERDSQVSQMGTIYQDADCVHVWLGPIAKTAHLLNELMTILSKRIPELRGRSREEFIEGLGKVLNDPSLEEYESAMFSACEATYWSRLWIVQEYVLARTTMIHFGLRVADPRPITYVAPLLLTLCYSSERVRGRTGWDNIRRSMLVNGLRKDYRDHDEKGENLFHLIERFYDLECSDHRDMIYGLHALSRGGEHEIPIDYSLTVEEVYQATAKFIIERLEEVDFIYILAGPRFNGHFDQERQLSLPSWVPDLHFRGPIRLLDQSPHVQAPAGTDFNASGSMKSQSYISENNKVLTCKGMVLGTINKVAFLYSQEDIVTNTRADFAHLYFSNLADFLRATFLDSEVTSQVNHGIEVIHQLLFVSSNIVPVVLITSKVFHEHCVSLLSPSPTARADAIKHLESTVNLNLLSNFIDDGTLFSVSNIFPKTSSTQEEESRVPTIGLCYPYCEPGDVLAILYGCTVPVALRPSNQNPGQFEVLCDVYVDGYMHGEAIGKFEEREFEIC